MAEARRERKVVTVLFADLVGFTSRAEQMDPAAIGDRPAEARARLRAGGENLARALDFYCSVGAIRYIREAETLLAASG